MIQEFAGLAIPAFRHTESWAANVACTALAVAGWGWFLVQGVTDPLGGINTLWPLFGIANQMLAAIALVFCCVVLLKTRRARHLWIALLPTAWLLACTLTAGWQKLFDANPKIGFLANARRFADALSRGEVLAPATSLAQMRQVLLNNRVDAALCALLLVVVIATLGFGLRAALVALRDRDPAAREAGDVALDAGVR
jgi:carbon starvation protein